jgi:hypothetical protein
MQNSFQPPPEVLELLLSFVPLPERMSSCCLVNKKFHAAAVAVTQCISADLKSDLTDDNSFRTWMQQHGGTVSSLKLARPYSKLSGLPCSALRHLDLSAYAAQLGLMDSQRQPVKDSSMILSAATGLTSLRITVDFLRPELCDDVAALQHLQHLEIQTGYAHLPVEFLLHMTQLTQFVFNPNDLTWGSSFLSHLSALTGLQSLDVDMASTRGACGTIHPAALVAIPQLQKLTYLSLRADSPGFEVSHTSMPAFSAVTGLQKLRLSGCSLDPTALPQCAPLQDLEVWVYSMQDSSSSSSSSTSSGGSLCSRGVPLLQYIGGLAELTRLHLGSSCHLFGPQAAEDLCERTARAPEFGALTASSSLQELNLRFEDLPAHAWELLFQLPAADSTTRYRVKQLRYLEAGGPTPGFVWGRRRSQPGLRQLKDLQTLILFEAVLDPDVLSELTQITRLSLYTVSVTSSQADDLSDATSAGSGCTQGSLLLHQLAQLQQLQHLEMFSTPHCTRSSDPLVTDTSSDTADTGHTVRSQLWPTAPEAYTALLASSRLVDLRVVQCQLPVSAWQHALAVPHTFPHLTSLLLEETATNGACLDTDSIDGLVERCPHLRKCCFNLDQGTRIAALRQLSALTSLELRSVTSAMLQQVAGLGGLKRLEQLRLECVQPFRLTDLLKLTVFAQLHLLCCSGQVLLLANKPVSSRSPIVWSVIGLQCRIQT